MGVNSSEVSYQFGQMGSVFITGTSAVTSNGVAGKEGAVFCAITFLEETEFAASNGLVAEDNTEFINSNALQSGISANTAVVDSEKFPKGVTIYGRFTQIQLSSGLAIAYLGY